MTDVLWLIPVQPRTHDEIKMTDCIFCKIIAGDIPADIVHQDDEVLAFRDLNPQAPTHILIIPKQHIATTNDIRPEQAELAGKLILAAQKIAHDEGIAESGYRTVLNCNAGAGQSVFHIHLHLLGGRPMGWPPG
jgi:histidine triad (HIT) family protein